MRPRQARAIATLLIFGGACTGDGAGARSVRAELPTARPSASAASSPASSAAPRSQPARIEVVVTDRDGRVDRDLPFVLARTGSFDTCLPKSAAGDLGTLMVVLGGEGRPHPDVESEGLSMPLVRCIMEIVNETRLDAGPIPERILYFSVE